MATSTSTTAMICDQTLYRVLLHLHWFDDEPVEHSEHRRVRLKALLRTDGWLPDGNDLPTREETTWRQGKLWDHWDEGEWNHHFYGLWFHEEYVIVRGIEQDGPKPAVDWINEAYQQLTRLPTPITDRSADETSRPYLLGQCWVWTGELEHPLDDTDPELFGQHEYWESLGRTRYGPGRYYAAPWGLFAYVVDEVEGLPRFDLYTTTEPEAKRQRDQFLFAEGMLALTAYLKATQDLWPRYEQLEPEAKRWENQVQSALPPPNSSKLWDLHHGMETLSRALMNYSRVLCRIERVQHSLKLAQQTLQGYLREIDTALEPHPLSLAGLVQRRHLQIGSDLNYFRDTAEVGRQVAETYGVLVNIEEVKSERKLYWVALVVTLILGLGIVNDACQLWDRFVGNPAPVAITEPASPPTSKVEGEPKSPLTEGDPRPTPPSQTDPSEATTQP